MREWHTIFWRRFSACEDITDNGHSRSATTQKFTRGYAVNITRSEEAVNTVSKRSCHVIKIFRSRNIEAYSLRRKETFSLNPTSKQNSTVAGELALNDCFVFLNERRQFHFMRVRSVHKRKRTTGEKALVNTRYQLIRTDDH